MNAVAYRQLRKAHNYTDNLHLSYVHLGEMTFGLFTQRRTIYAARTIYAHA